MMKMRCLHYVILLLGLGFLLFAVECSCWKYHGDIALLANLSAVTREDANIQCESEGGFLVDPVTDNIHDTVVAAVLDLYPVTTFWTGFTRTTNETWTSAFYHAAHSSLFWHVGNSTTDPGDCLIMEVMPWEIRYMVDDCTLYHPYICYKLNDTEQFTEEEVYLPQENYKQLYGISEAECEFNCTLDSNCTAYYHNGFLCGLIYGPLTLTSTDTPPNDSNENRINSTCCNQTGSILCCFNNGSFIGANDTLFGANCSNYFNTSIVVNGSSSNGSSCVQLNSTNDGQLIPQVNISIRIGCTTPGNPLGGGNLKNTYEGRLLSYNCPWNRKKTPTSNITCGSDFKWSQTPYCKQQALRCPNGWEQYDEHCYLVQLSTGTFQEIPELCAAYNAFPLYLGSKDEMTFVDKLLYFHKQFNFWTGISNVNDATFFELVHNTEELEYLTNWKGWSAPSEQGCVALQRMVDGVDNGRFYYNITECTEQLPYVCKMGSAALGESCLGDSWCKGHAVCKKQHGNKFCSCAGKRKLRIGDVGDPQSYCSYEPMFVGDFVILNPRLSLPWLSAAAFCKGLGSSLFTPVSKDMQDLAMSVLWNSGTVETSWTGLHVHGGALKWKGHSEYELTGAKYLPWRNPPNFQALNESNKCVVMDIAEIGVRFFALEMCDNKYNAICIKYNATVAVLEDSDNTGIAPSLSYNVDTEEECDLDFLYQSQFVSFAFNKTSKVCAFFDHSGTGNGHQDLVQKKIKGCSHLSAPSHGNLSSSVNRQVGMSVTYTCDTLYKIPDDVSSTITCTAKGRWNHVPVCIPEMKKCPDYWEQNGTACYFLSDQKLPGGTQLKWANAVSTCNNMGGYLLELYTPEELQFVSQMLDVNRWEEFWSGGTDANIELFFTWSRDIYSKISYAPFFTKLQGKFVQPSAGLTDNCLALRRIYNDTDYKQFYLDDKPCSDEKRYVCAMKVINIGSTGCSPYGFYSCKVNSYCVNDTCTCGSNYFQIGDDGKDDTKCVQIKPIGGTGCLGYDELCRGDSVCSNGKCKCPTDMYQNGPDLSMSSECTTITPRCPSNDWRYYKGHCYSVFLNAFKTTLNYGTGTPQFACGSRMAHLATIHSHDDNIFIAQLGTSRSSRWIGIQHDSKTAEVWPDLSPVTYFNYDTMNNTLTSFCTLMDMVYLWRRKTCWDDKASLNVVCERTGQCVKVPDIPHAVTPASIVAELDTTYKYTCLPGYIFSGGHNGLIVCEEVNRTSTWSALPTCQSLLDEHFTLTTTPLYGTVIGSTDNSNIHLCSGNCFNSECQAFTIENNVTCSLYTDVATSHSGNLVQLQPDSWRRNPLCGAVPYSKFTTATFSGRAPGDLLRYRCAINYRIDRSNSSVLTCLNKGTWNNPAPACVSRFRRMTGKHSTSRGKKPYYKIYSADACERTCLEEKDFRCVRAMLYKGVCFLFDTFMINSRGEYEYDTDVDSSQVTIISELIDADMDEFDMQYEKTISETPSMLIEDNVSYEACAQECLFQNCTLFIYERLNFTCALYSKTINELTLVDVDVALKVHLFMRRYECGSPPSVSNGKLKPYLQQTSGVYSIGDVYQVECEVYGEELLNRHNGSIQCLKTGHWSPPPVCKNVCDAGWYMRNYTCYKLIDTAASFWQARNECHSHDAGLVNIQHPTELGVLQSIWNWTGSATTEIWLGLYSDMESWRWSERLGGDVRILFPEIEAPLANSSVTFHFATSVIHRTSVDATKSYMCEKAAANLVCPDGWKELQGRCLLLSNVTRTYTGSKTYCSGLGGSLAVVDSWHSRDVIGAMVSDKGLTQAYVGIYKPENGIYMLENGYIPKHGYTNFISDTYTEICGVMKDKNNLALVACTTDIHFVCQVNIDKIGEPKDLSNLPCSTDAFCNDSRMHCVGSITHAPRCTGKECPPPWVILNGRCYLYSNKSTTAIKHTEYCVKRGGHLFVPNDMFELYRLFFWIKSITNNQLTHVRVGLNKQTGGDFLDPFSGNKPGFLSSIVHSECSMISLKMKNIGLMMSDSCGAVFHGICEKDPVKSNKDGIMYEGCFSEPLNGKDMDLGHFHFTSNLMTIDLCVDHCRDLGFKFAGLHNKGSCSCGNTRGNYIRTLVANCDLNCHGNTSQICGGVNANSVYRTSAEPCSPTMPYSPMDPRICYSVVLASIKHAAAKYDCILQGGDFIHGDLVSINNEIIEESLYNQLMLKTLRSEEIVTPYIGIDQERNSFHKWEDGSMAEWLMIINENRFNYWLYGAVLNMSMGGSWSEEQIFTSLHPYVCQFGNIHQKVKGNTLQRRLKASGVEHFHTSGSFPLGSAFDFDCLINRERCPDGFSIHIWLKVDNVSDIRPIITTGDCQTDVLASDGFCLFYHPYRESISVIDVHHQEVYKLEFPLKRNIWTHILIYFNATTNIVVYANGIYLNELERYPSILYSSMIQESGPNIFLCDEETDDIITKNITFMAAPPDEVLLSHIQNMPGNDSEMEFPSDTNVTSDKQAWEHFQPWGMNLSTWSSAGIDGNGLKLSEKSFTYHLGEYGIEWMTLPPGDSQFLLSLWIKIPLHVKENVNILNTGPNRDKDLGVYIYYNVKSSSVEFSISFKNTLYTGSYATLFDEWRHYSIVISNTVTLYVNGEYEDVLSGRSKSTPWKDNAVSTVYAGSGVCPLGWIQSGLSCYYKTLTTQLEFWDQEHHCRSMNGHLLALDDEEELGFTKAFLNNSGKVYTGIYDIMQEASERRWYSTSGYLHRNVLFNDSSITTEERTQQNFIQMHLGTDYIGAYPTQSGNFDTGVKESVNTSVGNTTSDNSTIANSTEDYTTTIVAITTTTELTPTTPSVFATAACEIDMKRKRTRQQQSERCRSGWYFWQNSCYKLNTNPMTNDEAQLECAKSRSSLVNIMTKEEHAFLAAWLSSKNITNIYIGLRVRQPLWGNATYMWEDVRQLEYTSWRPNTTHTEDCVAMHCAESTCPWKTYSCSVLLESICKKSADTRCGVGWRMHKDKCVAVYGNSTTSVGKSICTGAGAKPMVFENKADMDEYLYEFGVGGEICLTDGIVNNGSGFVWKTNMEKTFFDGEVLTGSGTCVGLASSGMVKKDCSSFTCVLCQHYQSAGIEIDNIQMMMDTFTAGELKEIYSKNEVLNETYIWEMESNVNASILGRASFTYNKTTTAESVFLSIKDGIDIIEDRIMGNVLKFSNSSSAAQYNLTSSDSCLTNLLNCKLGVTAMFWLKGSNLTDCVLLDTKTDGTTGIKVAIDSSGYRLVVTIFELNYYWEGWIWLIAEEWVHILITWQKNTGLKFYTNFLLIYTVRTWQRSPSFVPVSTKSSHLLVGVCSSDIDPNIMIDDLEIRNYEMSEGQVSEYCKKKDKKKILDFNTLADTSFTNINVKLNSSLTSAIWRNSLFLHALRVDNKNGLSPAVFSQQPLHCLTRTDVCIGDFTTSFWLRPLDLVSDQIFLYTGTKISSSMDAVSLKFWYNATAGEYLLELFNDKTRFINVLYIDAFEWSHLVIIGNMMESRVQVFVNGQESTTQQTTEYIPERVPLTATLTFLVIGKQGTFEIDDVQHIQRKSLPSTFHVLKSCEEFELAGFRGIQNLLVDPNKLDDINLAENTTCILNAFDLYYFPLNISETTTIENVLSISHMKDGRDIQGSTVEGVVGEAVDLNGSLLQLNSSDIKCFNDVKHCFFGFTIAFWVKLDLSGSNITFTLFRHGGKVNNESGIDIKCRNSGLNQTHRGSVQCTAALINGTKSWSSRFYLQNRNWYHIALTWNPHRNLVLYKNGKRLLNDDKTINSYRTPLVTNPTYTSNDMCLGVCGENISGVKLVADELYILDMDVEEKKIWQLYGFGNVCWRDMRFTYMDHTKMCYMMADYTLSYSAAENTCQSFGGNLAVEPDIGTHSRLLELQIKELSSSDFAYIALKDLPIHKSRKLRWPDGSFSAFNTRNMDVAFNEPAKFCITIGNNNWQKIQCTNVRNFVCQTEPWHVMDIPLHLNYTSLSSMEGEGVIPMEWLGNFTTARGETQTSMVFNDSLVRMRLSDRCLVNMHFCNHGLSVVFWFKTLTNVPKNSKQLILSTMSNVTSHGIQLYLLSDNSGTVKLGIDVRNSAVFVSTLVPVTLYHWTNVGLSINNQTNVTVYMNGKESSGASVVRDYDLKNLAARDHGEEVDFTVGYGDNGGNVSVMMLDNMTIWEYPILDSDSLHQAVYDNFPDFYLSFDDVSLLVALSSDVTSKTDGWLSNYLHFDGTSSTRFIGQFYQDCFDAPDLCRQGFSLSVWLKPSSLNTDQGVISAINAARGFSISYHRSLHGIPESFWLTIKNNINEVRLPFKLHKDIWSHVYVSWNTNGSFSLLVNGIAHETTHSTSVTPATVSSTKFLSLGSISVTTPQISGTYWGGIDEILFQPRYISRQDMLDIYKNGTFIRSPYSYSFNNPSREVEGDADSTDGVDGNGSSIVSGVHWLNLTSHFNHTNKLLDIDKCVHGLTVGLYIKFMQENDTDQILIATSGNIANGIGLTVSYTAMNTSMPFRRYFEVCLMTSSHEYKAWFNMKWNIWNHVIISYHPLFGIKVFVDGILNSIKSNTTARTSSMTSTEQHLIVGELQDVQVSKGKYAIDELMVLDRALFGDTTIQNEFWLHRNHRRISPGTLSAVFTELTKNECHSICLNTSCHDFSVCGTDLYSTCYIATDSSVSSYIPQENCDTFTDVQIPKLVQTLGCFLLVDIANSFTELNNSTSFNPTSCIASCQSYSLYHYAGFLASTSRCFCGNDDIADLKPNSNRNCSALYVPVYQLSGLRNMMNVTVKIDTFDVDLDPGNDVLVGTEMMMTFTTNTSAFAGYRIDPGDGTPKYFTGRNYTTHVYDVVGTFTLDIIAMNEISWRNNTQIVNVMDKIDNINIVANSLIPTDLSTIVSVYGNKGSHAVCNIDWGDGTVAEVQHNNMSLPFSVSHTYHEEGKWDVRVVCNNSISTAANSTSIETLHQIVDIQLVTPFSTEFGQPINVSWLAVKGSNVTLNISIGDALIGSHYIPTLNHSGSMLITSTQYGTVGKHNITMSAANAVTNKSLRRNLVYVDVKIKNFKINTTIIYYRTYNMITIPISFENGSNVDISISYGDGSVSASHFPGITSNFHRYWGHTYLSFSKFIVYVYANNSVNALNDSIEFYLEHELQNVTFLLNNSCDPNRFVNYSLNADLHFLPIPVFIDLSFGDSVGMTQHALSLDHTGQAFLHNYTVNGYFNVSMRVYNNVSTIYHTERIRSGCPITDLKVDTDDSVAYGQSSNFEINIGAGSLVLYNVSFGDGSPIISSTLPVTFPNALLELNHKYLKIGIYNITVLAFNSFGVVVNSSVSVAVQEEVTGLYVVPDRQVSKANLPMTFYIKFTTPGTDSCIHFRSGDGSNHVFGERVCEEKPEYQNMTYRYYSPGVFMEFNYTYKEPGEFKVVVEASNEVSWDRESFQIKILEFPCDFPKINISGFSTDINNPTSRYSAYPTVIRTRAYTHCYPVRDVIFEWTVKRTDGAALHTNISNTLPFLTLPSGSLKHGLYKVNVTIYIDGFPVFNDTKIVYLKLLQSPLVLAIIGDLQRTVRKGFPVVLDSSRSFDPDFHLYNNQHSVSWYCWNSVDEFNDTIHSNSDYLKSIDSKYCHENVKGDQTVLVLPKDDFNLGMSKVYVAKMIEGSRVAWKSQKILVIQDVWPQMSLRCMENCDIIISKDLPLRVKGECQSCTFENRLKLAYKWRLYEIRGTGSREITNLEYWTTTGITSANLAIRANTLKEGTTYELRLENGQAFTMTRFRVSQPPYNGHCKSDRKTGIALGTKFVISCSNWTDEGENIDRNIAEDSKSYHQFEYTFYYDLGGHFERVPMFRTIGSDVETSEIMFGNGLPSNDFNINITVHIKDIYGSVTEYALQIKVLEAIHSISELLLGNNMVRCEAEKDLMCMLMLNNGIAEMANRQNDTSDAVKPGDTIIKQLSENKALIQDEVLAQLTTSLLWKVQQQPDTLSMEAKKKMADLYTSVLASLESSFKETMTSTEKVSLSKGILRGVVTFCQNVKFDPDCTADDCAAQKEIGNVAIDIMSVSDNITRLLLEDTIAGEPGVSLTIEKGNTYMHARRVESLYLSNATLQTEVHAIANIPDLSKVINLTSSEYLDVQYLVTDNFYTTDTSVQHIKSRSTSLSLMDSSATVRHLQGLVDPVVVKIYPAFLQSLNMSTVELSGTTMLYLKVELIETDAIPMVVFESANSSTSIHIYSKLGSMPTKKDYEFKYNVSVRNTSVNHSDVIRVTNEAMQTAAMIDTTLKYLYIGMLTDAVSAVSVDIGLFSTSCYYWDEVGKVWTRNGLSVGTVTNLTSIDCDSTHLSTFGMNIFVPPNTIDFNTVFSKFSADNLAVICTVGAVIALYFLVLIFVRREDKKDIEKWAIYPLCDNLSSDVYHYVMTVNTGIRSGAGTKSKVFFVIGGENGDTEIRALTDYQERTLSRGSVNNYLLSVPSSLGNLLFLRIWHDGSGTGEDGDWLLNSIIVKDVQTNSGYVFLCDKWLSLTKDDGQIDKVLPVANSSELEEFGHMFYTRTRRDFTDGHLWISVLSRPIQSNFTRVQRLSCCLSLLFLTMITNAMWYRTAENTSQQNVHLGPFVFSAQEFITSLLGSLIVVPVSLLIIAFFKNAERKKRNTNNTDVDQNKDLHVSNSDEKGRERKLSVFSLLQTPNVYDEVKHRCASPSAVTVNFSQDKPQGIDLVHPFSRTKTAKKKRFKLPHWCLYIAWVLVLLSVLGAGFFTILYSMEWGSEKASQWLTAFILSFVESVILIQPLKVIAVALVLVLIFKTVDEDDEEYENLMMVPQTDTPITQIKRLEHRRPYIAESSNNEEMEDLRLYRKRCNRLIGICRSIGAYITYLVILAILAYENRNKNAYATYFNLQNIFLQPQTIYNKSFVNITSAESFFHWSHNVLVPGLYSSGAHNSSEDFSGYVADNTHYRVGTPRLRQARVVQGECKVPGEYVNFFKDCYPDYSYKASDDDSYDEGWKPLSANGSSGAWQYKSVLDLNGYPIVGTYNSYGGGGYVVSLGESNTSAMSTLAYIEENNWITRNTRAVMVEGVVYNPNINLFSILCLVLEFPSTGQVIPYSQISPVTLYRYNGASAIFLLVVDLCFVVFTIYFLVQLIRRFKEQGWQFFGAFWNFIDFMNMLLSLFACACYGIHFVAVKLVMSDFHKNRGAYLNLQTVLLWYELLGYAVAFLLFFSMLKLLTIIRFNAKITQLSGTLKKACGPIASFLVVLVVVFLAFAQLGYLVFGRIDREFSTMVYTLETLISMLMMKMNIDDMLRVNKLLAMAYLFLFALSIVFVLINILLSIINEAFTDVRNDPSCLPDDPEMATFLMDQIKKVVLGYTSKKDRKTHENKAESDEDIAGKIDKMELNVKRYLTAVYSDRP